MKKANESRISQLRNVDLAKFKNQTLSTLVKPSSLPTYQLVKQPDVARISTPSGSMSIAAVTPAYQTEILFPSGMLLKRVYDSSSGVPIDVQCGSSTYWASVANEIKAQFPSSYNDASGQNKFLSKITLNSYADAIPFPQSSYYAYTIAKSQGSKSSDIYTRRSHSQSVVSHEIGHAFHNWTSFLDKPSAPYYSYLTNWWARQVTDPPVSYDVSKPGNMQASPWYTATETTHPRERFADAFRYHLGTNLARGINEGNKAGFKNPANNSQWKDQMLLMPDLTAYFDTYGLQTNTLSWLGSYWQFANSSGKYMAYTTSRQWYEWNGSNWISVSPSYTVT